MKVFFDLRPQYIVASQNTKIVPLRLIIVVLAAVFFIVSAFNIAFLLIELSDGRSELVSLRSEERRLTESQARILAAIEAMRKTRDDIKGIIDFRKQDIAAVEFLSSLEGVVPPGLKISKMEIRQGAVTMNGSSLDDKSIIDFGSQLGELRGIVSHVSAPVTVRSSIGSRMISDFTLRCSILPLSGLYEAMRSRIDFTKEAAR